MMSRRRATDIDLGGAWSFALADAELDVGEGSVEAFRRAGLTVYPATVPGNLELDLLANGLIEEPFVGMNIVSLRRFERSFVYYLRTFDAPPRPGWAACPRVRRCRLRRVDLPEHAPCPSKRQHAHRAPRAGRRRAEARRGENRCASTFRPVDAGRSVARPCATHRACRPREADTRACTSARRRTCTAGTSCRGRSRPGIWRAGHPSLPASRADRLGVAGDGSASTPMGCRGPTRPPLPVPSTVDPAHPVRTAPVAARCDGTGFECTVPLLFDAGAGSLSSAPPAPVVATRPGSGAPLRRDRWSC